MLALAETKPAENNLLLYKLNDGAETVDALPYVDAFTDELKEEMKGLIAAEMAEFKPRDYLEALSFPRTPFLDAAFNDLPARILEEDVAMNCERDVQPLFPFGWQYEISRIKRDEGPFQKLDMSRCDIPVPSDGEITDLSGWKQCLENAKAQAENSNTRLVNLELSLKYAQQSWLKHLQDLQSHETLQVYTYGVPFEIFSCRCKKRVGSLAASVEALNKKRKLDQVTGANSLRNLLREYEDTFERNIQVFPAIFKLQEEIDLMVDVLETEPF